MNQESNISVIIPVLGNYTYTVGCLLSLFENSSVVDEIIIIDNDENASTAKIVIENYPQVSLIVPKRNLGVATSWDIGIKAAKNNIVAVMNNDIKILDKNWDRLLLEEWATYEKTAVFCPWPVSTEDEYLSGLPYEGLNGSCFLINKELLRSTTNYLVKGQYIDNNYKTAYWEDVDLLTQVRRAGMNALVSKNVRALHYGNKTAGPLLPRDKSMNNPYWANLDYLNHKYGVHIWDYFEVYMSNVLRENTHEKLL